MKKSIGSALRISKKILKMGFSAKYRMYTLAGVASFIALLFASMYAMDHYLIGQYYNLESPVIRDRNGVILSLQPNSKQAYGLYVDSFPPHVLDMLVQKEDRFFYWHPGINPFSTLRAIYRFFAGKRLGGTSTITQQLAKILLSHEQDRSLGNKIEETFCAFSLELFNSKATILNMYANSVYMGNSVQGLDAAAPLYFGKKLSDLDDTKLLMLLATISSPTGQNPWQNANARASRNLALQLNIPFDPKLAIVSDVHTYAPPHNFELSAMQQTCAKDCVTTLDLDLTNRIRDILAKHIEISWDAGARGGAVVVIKLPENQILSFVGTPNENSFEEGQQIDMAIQPRPIGSTAKPFIYLEGFAKGLRPYTLVDDREYKFPIGNGFPLYPKNYDGMYRGWTTLHSALSNSLNVPTVKTLQYIGLPDFYSFLEQSLQFEPSRDLDEYQYGIALGALDMDPLTLAYFLSLFPNQGELRPLQLYMSGNTPFLKAPMSNASVEKKIADPALTQLVTKVLNDRLTGVQQFGLESSLNLPEPNYAVKTGTSENYHDSWTVGYTPDFLVVVWFGNPDNTPLKHVTGQSGAGAIWHDTMQLLMNSLYNKKTPFDFSQVQNIPIDGSIDFGLKGDVVSEHRNLLPDNELILSPQDGDTFLSEASTVIPLVSPQNVSWYVNSNFVGTGEQINFSPHGADDYTIKASASDGTSQKIVVHVIVRQ